MRYNLFIGRWSPFHDGHKYIIDTFVNNGKAVCIGIRDTELSESDPFSAEARKKIIDNVYKDNDNVKSLIIPDIESVCVGRGVGYNIMDVPQEIKKISGTKARANSEHKISGLNQKGICLWFTGLPCSGKTTLAQELKKYYQNEGLVVQHLDGDEIRKTISKDLGFSKEDRAENLRRVAKIAKILVEKNIIVLCTFVSPYREIRKELRDTIPEFNEIYVKCSSVICAKRDVKGMWAKAKAGEIDRFTGYNDPYEEPLNPELIVDTSFYDLDISTAEIMYKYRPKELLCY
jgi:adenylylsulfate kinase